LQQVACKIILKKVRVFLALSDGRPKRLFSFTAALRKMKGDANRAVSGPAPQNDVMDDFFSMPIKKPN